MCEEKIKIYKKIIDAYGTEKQLIQAIEELSELLQALCKWVNGKGEIYEMQDNVAEEIADVSIMIDQLKIIFNNEDEVCKWVAKKVKRTLNNVSKV